MDTNMKITDETITYVAALAKLDLSDDEKERAKTDLENIISYMDTMNEIDTSNVEPMSHAFPMKNVFREDVVTNSDDRDNLLSNAPVKKDGCFIVPKTVE
jgi:aspartyl-tRNA(Asn)/glutamyl-tRNA(Gln) amidotransferase subunit C